MDVNSLLIPKIFHYVWLGTKPIHPLMREWQERFKELHPSWKIKIWKEDPELGIGFLVCGDEMIECRHPEYLKTCPTYAKRSDVWRYDILEQQGGVYLDTDFEPIKNLEVALMGCEAFAGTCLTRYGWSDTCPEGHVKLEIGCSIMGCTPHHPWLCHLVSAVPFQSSQEQLALAFPFLTAITAKHPDVKLFEPNVFYPVPWDKYALGGKKTLYKEELPPETLAVHRWSSNWFDEGLKCRL